jgi:hypothetical protein
VTLNPTPNRQPDKILFHITSPEKSASSDLNTLYIDTVTTAAAGLRAKILTGTCTLSICVRHDVETFCAGDGGRSGSLKVRSSSTLFAALGKEIMTEMGEERKEGVGRRIL